MAKENVFIWKFRAFRHFVGTVRVATPEEEVEVRVFLLNIKLERFVKTNIRSRSFQLRFAQIEILARCRVDFRVCCNDLGFSCVKRWV